MQLKDYLDGEHGRKARVAKQIRMAPAFLSQIARGDRPIPVGQAADIEAACNFEVMRWDMFPMTWHRIWPELKAHALAPRLPDAVAEQPRQGANDIAQEAA